MLLVAIFAALLTVVWVGPAAAAPAAAAPYPPPVCATLSVSTTTPFPGQTITVSGVNFAPNEQITLVLDTGATLGDVTVGADGTFSKDVVVPNDLRGNHRISVQG